MNNAETTENQQTELQSSSVQNTHYTIPKTIVQHSEHCSTPLVSPTQQQHSLNKSPMQWKHSTSKSPKQHQHSPHKSRFSPATNSRFAIESVGNTKVPLCDSSHSKKVNSEDSLFVSPVNSAMEVAVDDNPSTGAIHKCKTPSDVESSLSHSPDAKRTCVNAAGVSTTKQTFPSDDFVAPVLVDSSLKDIFGSPDINSTDLKVEPQGVSLLNLGLPPGYTKENLQQLINAHFSTTP